MCNTRKVAHRSVKLWLQFGKSLGVKYFGQDLVSPHFGFFCQGQAMQTSADDKPRPINGGFLNSIQPEFFPDSILEWGVPNRQCGITTGVIAKLHSIQQLSVNARLDPILDGHVDLNPSETR